MRSVRVFVDTFIIMTASAEHHALGTPVIVVAHAGFQRKLAAISQTSLLCVYEGRTRTPSSFMSVQWLLSSKQLFMSKAMANEAKFPPGYFNGNSWEGTIELFICYKALQLNFNAARSIRVQQPRTVTHECQKVNSE